MWQPGEQVSERSETPKFLVDEPKRHTNSCFQVSQHLSPAFIYVWGQVLQRNVFQGNFLPYGTTTSARISRSSLSYYIMYGIRSVRLLKCLVLTIVQSSGRSKDIMKKCGNSDLTVWLMVRGNRSLLPATILLKEEAKTEVVISSLRINIRLYWLLRLIVIKLLLILS